MAVRDALEEKLTQTRPARKPARDRDRKDNDQHYKTLFRAFLRELTTQEFHLSPLGEPVLSVRYRQFGVASVLATNEVPAREEPAGLGAGHPHAARLA